MLGLISRPTWWGVILSAVLSTTTSGQVVVNEVLYNPNGADSGNEIVEIANVGAAAQVLTGWSVCVNFSAPFSRAYWNFPNGTTIQAGAFLKVHWLANGSNTATDLFTGTSPLNFTCFQPAQFLDNTTGSISIYRSQSCFGFGVAGKA